MAVLGCIQCVWVNLQRISKTFKDFTFTWWQGAASFSSYTHTFCCLFELLNDLLLGTCFYKEWRSPTRGLSLHRVSVFYFSVQWIRVQSDPSKTSSWRPHGANKYICIINSTYINILHLINILHVKCTWLFFLTLGMARSGKTPDLRSHWEVPSLPRRRNAGVHTGKSRCFQASDASGGARRWCLNSETLWRSVSFVWCKTSWDGHDWSSMKWVYIYIYSRFFFQGQAARTYHQTRVIFEPGKFSVGWLMRVLVCLISSSEWMSVGM